MALLARSEGADASNIDYPLIEAFDRESTASWPANASVDACPHCSGTPVNGQGVLDCPDCGWTS